MIDHLVRGGLLVLIGGLLIAGGGIFTTLGWNTLRERSQMRALVSGLAREWEINNKLLAKDPLLTGTDDAALRSHALYPRFYTNAASAILTSGLFDPTNGRDRTLLHAVADYQESALDTNGRLAVSDSFVAHTEDAQRIRAHRLTLLQSLGFKSFKALHLKVGDLLRGEYAWAQRPFLD